MIEFTVGQVCSRGLQPAFSFDAFVFLSENGTRAEARDYILDPKDWFDD